MALVFCDGFEQYSTAASWATIVGTGQAASPPVFTGYGWSRAYSNYNGHDVIASTATYRTGQTGTAKSLLVETAEAVCNMPSPASIVVGFGFRTTSLSDRTITKFSSDGLAASDLGLRVQVLSTGALRFYNEATNAEIVSSATGIIAINTWYYIELKIIFGVAAGSVEARVDETVQCSASLVDTLCGSSAATTFHLLNSSTSGVHYYDDLYILDMTGTTNNDYLGAVGIYTLFPDANGDTNQFSPTGSATNYQNVDESTPDFTSYNSSATSGDTELYGVQSLPITPSSIAGVSVAARVQDLGANPSNGNTVGIKTSGTSLFGANQKGTFGSWTTIRSVFEKQADQSSSWDEAAITSLQIGVKNS